MSGSTRIKGVALTLQIGTPPIDYKCDVTKCSITNEEGKGKDNVVTFCDAAQGGTFTYFLNLSGIQSTDAASLWRYVWEHSGEKVAFTYAPHGNAQASAAQPHFIGMVTIGQKPEIGGEAGSDKTFTFDSKWEIDGVPTLDTGA